MKCQASQSICGGNLTLVNSIDLISIFLFHFLFGKAPDAVYLESKPLIVAMGELHQICNKNSEEIARIQSNIFHVFLGCYKQRKKVYLN